MRFIPFHFYVLENPQALCFLSLARASRQKMANTQPQPSQNFSIGVTATAEVVWKDREVFVLQGLVLADGKKFVRLTKDKYSVLNQLLVPAAQRKALFPKTRLFEEITALRTATARALTNELLAAGRETCDSDDDAAATGQDPTALLGLDKPGRQPRAQPRRERRRKQNAARAQLPATASVSYMPSAGGEPWAFVVVLDVGLAGNKSAAIELTASNLERLRGFLAEEITTIAAALGSHASAPENEAVEVRPLVQKAPRGTRGNREYYTKSKNKWVRKRLVQGGLDGVRKYRCLTRNPTNPEMPAAVAVPEREEGASGGGEESVSEVDATADLGL